MGDNRPAMSDTLLDRRRAELERLQRDHLVQAFAAVALEKGYAGATIADIVRVAQVSKSTFYAHFADKEALYLRLHSDVADALHAALTASVARTADETDWRSRVRDLVRSRLDLMAESPTFLAQLRIEPQIATDAAQKARRAAGRRSVAVYRELSRQIAQTSPEVDELPDEILIAGLSGNLALIARAAERGPGAVRALEDALTDYWVRLFRT
jgi:AcrR family transcriptional regulator